MLETEVHLALQPTSRPPDQELEAVLASAVPEDDQELRALQPAGEELRALLASAVPALEDVVRVIQRIGVNKGFEEALVLAATNMASRYKYSSWQ